MIGTRLAHYEITHHLGSGGMGEVYRATDTKLSRDIALKIILQQFAADTDRMARFQREAQVLASLNHPHIATIHGLEEAGALRALVMELVEGPTLSDRIARGLIPIEEALPMAKQIAEAIEYAHERGVVHRDLKPANIKLTSDGQIKVLDFGLAKAMSGESAPESLSDSPTLSLAATQAGVILGTTGYMSPEQAKGRAVDRRADIWSFGVVLFEMLTGRMLFTGETASETMAFVMTKEPDWNALPSNTPSAIRELLRRCLIKNPRSRMQAIGDARILIEETIANPQQPISNSAADLRASATLPRWRGTAPWAVAGIFAIVAAAVLWTSWRSAPDPAAAVRLTADLGAETNLLATYGAAAVLSPDGLVLAFVGTDEGRPRIYVRPLDQVQASPLAGTDGARNLFFSPDGRWIAFFADGKLKKISVTGGAAVTLCDAPDDRGGAWSEDGTVVFAPTTTSPLLRVSSGGGKPEPVTRLEPGENEISHRWPQILPGGQGLLYTGNSTGDFNNATVVAQSQAGERRVVFRGGYYARYLPSGHLVFVRESTLFAASFDLRRMQLVGDPIPVLEGVRSTSGNGGAHFAFSNNGDLLYLPGADIGSASIYWMDRAGKTSPLRRQTASYLSPRFSPDGRKLAVQILGDIWVYEWQRDIMSRLTVDPAPDSVPVWTPDGRRISFHSTRNNTEGIYWQRADGSDNAQLLTETTGRPHGGDWHPGGKYLAFPKTGAQTSVDIMVLPVEGDETSGLKPGKPTVFLASPFTDVNPAFSPDGRWLAYSSSETGNFEVYVRPFPGPGGEWQISSNGGNFPMWSRNSKELFYMTDTKNIMAVTYSVERDSFSRSQPRQISDGQFAARGIFYNYALHPDGQRFAVFNRPEESSTRNNQVSFFFNFFDELRRMAPVK